MSAAERVAGCVEVVEQRALGHLEAEAARVDGEVLQRARHEGGEVGPLQLAARDVGRDRQPFARGAVGGGRAQQLARALEHPLADGDDDAGLLRDAQEVAGHDEAPHRVVPAQQRLDRDPAAGGEVELGLEQHPQLVLLQRAPERALGQQPGHRLGVHGLVEQLVAGTAAALGAVHRGVGVLQQRRRAVGRRGG